MADALTFSDVMARAITVEWFEAVAFVRAAVEALPRDAKNAQLIPEPNQIHLSADGSVHVRGGAPVHEPVRRLGQLLQAALGQAEPPVQLRLAISKATAPVPAYAGVQEYDEALAYFERPDRAAVLQHLFARASQASVVRRLDEAASLDAIAPLPSSESSNGSQAKKTTKSSTRAGRLVPLAAGIAMITMAVVVFAKRGVAPGGSSVDLATTFYRGIDTAGTAMMNGLSFVTERVGLGRLVSADAPVAVEGPMPAAATPATTRPRTASPEKSSTAAPKPSSAVRPAASQQEVSTRSRPANRASAAVRRDGVSSRAALPASVTLPPELAAFDLEPARPAAPPARPVADETIFVPVAAPIDGSADAPIYSSQSEDVLPPMAVRPQLPRELPPDVNRSDLREIDLVISRAGTVESVKLVGWPRNVHDSMLLSAVKAWEFVPALKNGVPVRYHKTIWVARQP